MKIKENKGITLIMLTMYLILTLIVLGVLASVTAYFRKNMNNLNEQTVYDTEFDRINLVLLKEMKTLGNKVDEENSTTNKIAFNENYYIYDSNDKIIYLNGNIKIVENVTSFTYSVQNINNKQKLTVNIGINGTVKTKEYNELVCEHTYSNGVCTKCGLVCAHTYENGICTLCGTEEP